MLHLRSLSPFAGTEISNHSKISPEAKEITKKYLKSVENHYIKGFNKSEITAKLFQENTSPENKSLAKICKKLFSYAEYSENISAEKVKKLLDHLEGFKSLGVNNARIILAVAYSLADTINNNPYKEEVLKHLHEITQNNLSSLENNVLTIDFTHLSTDVVQDLFKKTQNVEKDVQQQQIFHSEETSTMKQVASTAIKLVLGAAGVLVGAKIIGSLYQKLPSPNSPTSFPTLTPDFNVPSVTPIPAPVPTPVPVPTPEPVSYIINNPVEITPVSTPAPEPTPVPSLIVREEFNPVSNEPAPAPAVEEIPVEAQETVPAPVIVQPNPAPQSEPAAPTPASAESNNTQDSTENDTETPPAIEYEAPKQGSKAEDRRARKEKEEFTESRKPWEKVDSFATFLAAAFIPAALLSNTIKISNPFATPPKKLTSKERNARLRETTQRNIKKSNQESWMSWPALGPVLGAMGGAAARLANDSNVHSLKKAAFCDSAINKAFGLVNEFKQWEIKNFAPFTPAVLMAGNFGLGGIAATANSISNRSFKPLKSWIAKEGKALPKKDVAIGVSLFALSFLANIYQASVLPAGFDPSGHVMMKAATTYQMLTALQYLKNSGCPGVDKIAGLWALSEAYFMGNVTCYHSVSELIAGGFFASALKVSTDRASRRFA